MKSTLRKNFGLKVRELRKERNISQEVLAEKCDFARTYMSRIETGGSNVSLDAIEKIAKAFKISVEDLFKNL